MIPLELAQMLTHELIAKGHALGQVVAKAHVLVLRAVEVDDVERDVVNKLDRLDLALDLRMQQQVDNVGQGIHRRIYWIELGVGMAAGDCRGRLAPT